MNAIANGGEGLPLRYCAVQPQRPRVLDGTISSSRERAILLGEGLWVNHTVLHYYFFDGEDAGSEVVDDAGQVQWVTWVGDKRQCDVVRQAFEQWKNLGLGLEFTEVPERSEAEIRIGFMAGDGSWSFVGRTRVLQEPQTARTMNFGWDLTADAHGRTTALHEIGHTLGMPHEHQNPFAGIEWDEPAVYTYFAGPPNEWDREKTYHNVLRKLEPRWVTGSHWDPDSVMQYSFPPRLIRKPEAYYDAGLRPPGTISPVDRQFAMSWYPAGKAALPTLQPFVSVGHSLTPGAQVDFEIRPDATQRRIISTFGATDTVMVLFEEVDGELRYVAGDDDSGEERNSRITTQLFRGRRYVVRIRLYHAGASGDLAVMYW
ncbi:Matrixin [Geodermatophilus telluris]|uniref:Matrixin n=1 Tax=Geodermatophilus telluris TaxID=1190417 RepID=A0A1G6S7H9_9ACTN|nr:matrixin family metalloprotease [Geodermatophilus telluris]SDD12779.1 Matrixin [Geodermatophilus telluris]